MAQVYLTRGDLDRALALYQDSLKLLEQVGDIQGKATSLAMVAQIYATQGDRQTALALLEESLAVFARLGMPRETAQVRELIAALAGGPAGPPTPLAEASGRARRAAQSGDLPAAIAAQQEAVALARGAGSERDDLVRLSVLLFNLGGYYSEAGDYAAAVAALQEVVALDERTGHPDLESDRATLEQARQMAALSPEERAALAAAAKQAAEQLAAMSEDERAGVMAAAQRAQIEQLATQARDATLAALRGETDRAGLAAQLEHVAGQAADGEAPGSPWLDVAGFIRAAAALLRGEPLPPVPAAYAGQFAALQDAAGGSS
jgi:tetratricopeptide (TPR) repeat protein